MGGDAGVGVHMRVYIRQGCELEAQCEGTGVDVQVVDTHEGEEKGVEVYVWDRRKSVCGVIWV